MKKTLENNLHTFLQSTPSETAIIGISGGVDSAVTLAIAVQALGEKNIRALLLPYKLGKFSSHENFEDAKKLCEDLHVAYSVIELDDFVAPYKKIFSDEKYLKKYSEPMILGNVLARIRMTLLFATANAENGIVLGTCNKTEIMLGYETKFGDGAADVSVIGDIWKYQVYELAHQYNLPKTFIEKSPSAELYIDQSDEKEMGFSYEIADKTCAKIEQMINEEKDIKFSDPIEQKIYRMYCSSNHKRIYTPILTLS